MFGFVLPICGGCLATILAGNLALSEKEVSKYECSNTSFSISRIDDVNYILEGQLEVPHSGYKYSTDSVSPDNVNISLFSDPGAFSMVISSVQIQVGLVNPAKVVGLNIEKSFNWGDSEIVCLAK